MAIRSSFFNSVNGDRRYLAYNFAEYFASFIGNGVFANPSNAFQVYEKENMIVNVKAGKAWINGYIAVNDGDYNLTITNADGVLNRIDRIVLRLDFNVRAINIAVKKGAFASTPVAPTLQRDAEVYELVLADVYVGKGITRITQSNITDQRMNKDLCGVVKGTVDQIDTTDLFNQYGSAFQEWFETVKNYLNDTAVGNVANKLAEHELSKGAHGLGIAELNTTAKTIREAINEVFISGNNVKKNMVDTLLSLDSTLPITINSGWSNIISALPNVSGKSAMNVFIQPTQPVTKDGIWFKTDYANRPEIENYAYQNYSDSLSLSTLTSPPVQIFSSSPLFHYKEKNMIILVFLTGNNVSIYTYDVLSRIYTLIYNADLGSGSRMYSFHKGYVYIFTVDSRAVRKIDVQTKMSTTLSYTGDLIPYSRDIFAEQDYLCVFLNGTLYKYDVKTNSVTKTIIATQPFANYSSASYFNGNLFVFVYANGFYHYNVQTNVWTKLKNNLPNGAAYTSLIANSQFDFYTLGGLNGSTYYSEIYKYDITEQIFKQVGNLSEKSNDLKAVIMENYIYVGGYYSPNVNVNKFERYAFDIGLIAGVNIDSINDLYKTALLSNKKYENLISIKNGFKSAYISLDGKTKLRGIDTYYGNGASWVLTNIK